MQPVRFGKTTVVVLTVIQEEFDAVLGAFGADCRCPGTNYWYGQHGADQFVVGKMADRGNALAAEATRDAIEHCGQTSCSSSPSPAHWSPAPRGSAMF